MGIVTGTMETYDQIGIREDLSDIIYDISPMETPFVSGAGRGEPVDNTLFEWQTDELAAASTSNAHTEGDEAAFTTPSATVRVGNYTQISKKTLIVSGTAEAVDTAGRQSELAYQLAKKGMELRRDLEAICLSNIAGAAGSSDVARTTATMNAWLQDSPDGNAFRGSGTPVGADSGHASGVPTSAATDAGTQRAITETLFKDVVAEVWTNGGNADTVIVGPFNKQQISENFAGVYTLELSKSEKDRTPGAAVAAIDVYVSDFGSFSIVADRFSRDRDLWLIDFDFVELAELRPLFQERLAKTGDAEKRQMIVEWGLRVKNQLAHGLLADLTTS